MAQCAHWEQRRSTIARGPSIDLPARWNPWASFANIFIGARLRGRKGDFYGITLLYQKDPEPLREDLPKVFSLLAEKKIDPLVHSTFPLLDARKALELLATGSVEGKIVLIAG
jgi:NADPH:quinone reductase-like Zn-dependent oxidoreductase